MAHTPRRARRARAPRIGYVVYDGPSAITGDRIGAILTLKSKNRKTGNMAQLWILVWSMRPGRAVRTGADRAICGHCPLRLKWVRINGKRVRVRRCYVTMKAPTSVWKAWRAGRYPVATPDQLRAALAGRRLRLGAYGEPTALPIGTVRELASYADRHTGYTHRYHLVPPQWSRLVMASADTPADRELARARGYRVFRARPKAAPDLPGEILCPASEEAGKRTQCARCGLCDGSTGAADRRADIVIPAHGTAARFFQLTPV